MSLEIENDSLIVKVEMEDVLAEGALEGLQEKAPLVTRATKFPMGDIVGTPGALSLLERNGITPESILARHSRGDWGQVHPGDVGMNDAALGKADQAFVDGKPWKAQDKDNQDRLLSVYEVGDEKVWVITEWDRSVTTILLPEDY